MRRVTIIDSATAAVLIADVDSINVSPRFPITLAAAGLQAAEVIDVHVLINGAYAAVPTLQLSVSENIKVLDKAGTYKISKGVTAGAVSVDKAWSGN